MRLFVNFFQPSFKLKEKHRDGAKVIKRYHRPATPYQRLLDDARTPEDTCLRLKAMYLTLDPVRLLRDIRLAQERLVEIADKPDGPPATDGEALPLEDFLSGLRIAWRGGEVKPTARSKPAESESGGGPILYSPSLPNSRIGSRRSLGELRESCSNACRSNTPACIPTASFGPCSVE